MYLTISVLELMCFGQNGKLKFEDVTQGTHALTYDGGSHCIPPTYQFIQFVFNRFYDNRTYFDLLKMLLHDAVYETIMMQDELSGCGNIIKWYRQFAKTYFEMLLKASIV